MVLFLDHAWERMKQRRAAEGKQPTLDDLYAAVMEGGVERLRPKMMTVSAIIAGLLPIMWGHGTGSEIMRRIATPMVGGMMDSAAITLLVIPSIYAMIHESRLKKAQAALKADPGAQHQDSRGTTEQV